MPENLALGVVYLRNSRAHVPDKYDSGRLDGKILSHDLLRPELISISLAAYYPEWVVSRNIKINFGQSDTVKIARQKTNQPNS